MAENGQPNAIDFTVDQKNLYREENITDMKVAAIRKMTPITPSGEVDEGRTAMFVGTTQLMTPEGPLPIQAMLEANNLQEAFNVFPRAMEEAMLQLQELIFRVLWMKLNHWSLGLLVICLAFKQR